jgi:gag-polypeptide of LTR copia-type
MFEALKAQHEQQGAFAQINLLLKGLQTEFIYEKSIRDMVSEMQTYYQCIAAMGQLKLDDIFSILLLKGMNRHFGPLQQTIHSMSSNNSNFNSELIVAHLLDEDALV